MNCRTFQSQLVQLSDGSPTNELVAHARECAACGQALEGRMHQEEWLRERFDTVSIQLLAGAPPFSDVAFRKTIERPARGVLLPWAVGAMAILMTAAIGWWQWTNPTGGSKTAATERPEPRDSASQLTANSVPAATPRPKIVAPLAEPKLPPIPNPASRSLAGTTPAQAPSAVPGKSPATKSRVAAAHVFKMTPTAFAPDAQGYLATIIPEDATSQAPAMIALSLTGLPAESVFHIRTRDIQGRLVWLASLTTDANGSGAVMLRSGPAIVSTGRPLATMGKTPSPLAGAEPTVALDFGDDNSPPGGNLDVVDNAGNLTLEVSPATVTPTATP